MSNKTAHSANLRRRCRKQRGRTVEEDRSVGLLLTFSTVIPAVRHPVISHHHQEGVVLQTVHHRPGGEGWRWSEGFQEEINEIKVQEQLILMFNY